MYAVILTGGKQYKVIEGQTLQVERLDVEVGETVVFDKVLMLMGDQGMSVGRPYLTATVRANVNKHGRGKKIEMIKFRRRKHSMKKQGHRQGFTEVTIHKIADK